MSEESTFSDAYAAMQTARLQVEEDMLLAKERYRADKSDATKADYQDAVAELQQARALERGNRGTQLAGDVFPTPPEDQVTGDEEN